MARPRFEDRRDGCEPFVEIADGGVDTLARGSRQHGQRRPGAASLHCVELRPGSGERSVQPGQAGVAGSQQGRTIASTVSRAVEVGPDRCEGGVAAEVGLAR